MARRTYTLEQLATPLGLWRWTRGLTLTSMALDFVLLGENAGELLSGASYRTHHLALAALGALSDASRYAVSIALIVLVCRLSYRAMRNLHILNPPVTLMGPAWAAGWYFTPASNLFMPYRAMRQMQQGSDALAARVIAASESTGPWWATWLVSLSVTALAIATHLQILAAGDWPKPELFDRALWISSAAALANFVCSLFFLDVFGRLARAQHDLVLHYTQTSPAERLT